MSGHLCLRWNNHNSAFNKLLNKIYLEDMYSDGTILCQGKFYPVHRFVLSTCSEYFEEIFRQCVRLNNKHPFIIVKDVNPIQMEALLNYMYKGEVNVPQEMLPELIKAAEAFKIKGLAVPDEGPSLKPSRKRSSASSPSSVPKRSRKQEQSSPNSNKDMRHDVVSDGENDRSDINSHLSDKSLPSTSNAQSEEYASEPTIPEIKTEPVEVQEPIPIPVVDNSEEDGSTLSQDPKIQNFESFNEDYSKFEVFDYDPSNENFDAGQSSSWDNSQTFEAEEGNEDDPTQRIQFPYDSSDSITIVKKKSGWQCPLCDYCRYKKSHVREHLMRHTREKPFQCPYCPYRVTEKRYLKRHWVSCRARPVCLLESVESCLETPND